jgi:hypothetical protein
VHFERGFVTGNEIPRIVAHRCIKEASIGKRIGQTIVLTCVVVTPSPLFFACFVPPEIKIKPLLSSVVVGYHRGVPCMLVLRTMWSV